MGTQDPSTIFNVDVPKVILDQVNQDRVAISRASLRTAFEAGPLAHLQCVTRLTITS